MYTNRNRGKIQEAPARISGLAEAFGLLQTEVEFVMNGRRRLPSPTLATEIIRTRYRVWVVHRDAAAGGLASRWGRMELLWARSFCWRSARLVAAGFNRTMRREQSAARAMVLAESGEAAAARMSAAQRIAIQARKKKPAESLSEVGARRASTAGKFLTLRAVSLPRPRRRSNRTNDPDKQN